MKRNYPWLHERRFNAFPNYCVRVFGERLQKVSVDAGFTCPNRDGTISTQGCFYCNNASFSPSYCNSSKNITEQIKEGIDFLNIRYKKAEKYLVYFQSYTNTYRKINELKSLYSEALSYNGVKGLIIGTRPDCITEELLDYLAELSENYYIVMEFGMETTNNNTLKFINRGHTFEQSVEALQLCASKKVLAGVHLIFGLPYENEEELLSRAHIISKLPVHAIKIHQLQIVKETVLETLYKKEPSAFLSFTLDSYIDLIIGFTERLNPDIIIDRFAGEVPPRFLAGPSIMKNNTYGYLRNDQILQMIEKRMEALDTWQGKGFKA